MKDIVIVGCGGFGREVLDVIEAINELDPTWNVLGFVDDAPTTVNTDLVERRGTTVLGEAEEVLAAMQPAHFVVGIGSPAVRRSLATRFEAAGWAAATLIHPRATLGGDNRIGDGVVICAGTVLTNNISVGRHTHINLLCSIGHDVVLEDFVSINPIVAVSGWVVVRSEAMVGTHAAILQNVTVGTGATVGGAALVAKDVPPGVIVKGVPAR